jgi:hypothetical protein
VDEINESRKDATATLAFGVGWDGVEKYDVIVVYVYSMSSVFNEWRSSEHW